MLVWKIKRFIITSSLIVVEITRYSINNQTKYMEDRCQCLLDESLKTGIRLKEVRLSPPMVDSKHESDSHW